MVFLAIRLFLSEIESMYIEKWLCRCAACLLQISYKDTQLCLQKQNWCGFLTILDANYEIFCEIGAICG